MGRFYLQNLLLVCSFFLIFSAAENNGGELVEEEIFELVIPELTLENFDSVIQSTPYVFVEFFAPWCGACKKFEPMLQDIAQLLQGSRIDIYKMDAWKTEHGPLNKKYNVSSYPTLVLFRNGQPKRFDEDFFQGPEFVISKLLRWSDPFCSEESRESLENFFTNSKSISEGHILGIFSTAHAQDVEQFFTLAENHRDEYRFHLFQSNDPVSFEGETFVAPQLLFYRPNEGKVSQLQDLSQAESWLFKSQFPAFGEITKANSKSYIESGIPLAMLFVTPEAKAQFTPIYSNFAKKFNEKNVQLHFVFLDWEKYGAQAAKLGLSGSKVPCFAIEDTKQKLHFAFDEKSEMTEEALANFITEYLAGNLKPSVVSQPIPEQSEENGVTVLVGANFNTVVAASSESFFVEFYAPWCGHCKKLAPVWEELAKTVKNDEKLKDEIVIAKIDAASNDVVYPNLDKVNSYPTLVFFPATDKENPTKYSAKERDLEALLGFVRENVKLTNNKDEL